MKPSMTMKLTSLIERHDELAALLSDADVINDNNQFRTLSQEYAQLDPLVNCFKQYQQTQEDIEAAKALLIESDPDLEKELQQLTQQADDLEQSLQIFLLPRDPDDDRNVYLEIRAGTGGDEAAIFAGNLFRMYSRYAEKKGWQVEILSAHQGEHGGFKEIISKVCGKSVYAQLKFESGAHRVQRVPETESQGRIHTSACTIAILPEVEAVDDVDIQTSDLRIDTFRASGAGGQHVNKTDSAIRITHLPSGIVVECQEERSQHKNRAKALSLLQAKLLAQAQAEQKQEQTDTRRQLIGSGDRSERIRTYNYPQGRITDHRINLTLYKLAEVMEGALEQVIQVLLNEHQADQLATLGE